MCNTCNPTRSHTFIIPSLLFTILFGCVSNNPVNNESDSYKKLDHIIGIIKKSEATGQTMEKAFALAESLDLKERTILSNKITALLQSQEIHYIIYRMNDDDRIEWNQIQKLIDDQKNKTHDEIISQYSQYLSLDDYMDGPHIKGSSETDALLAMLMVKLDRQRLSYGLRFICGIVIYPLVYSPRAFFNRLHKNGVTERDYNAFSDLFIFALYKINSKQVLRKGAWFVITSNIIARRGIKGQLKQTLEKIAKDKSIIKSSPHVAEHANALLLKKNTTPTELPGPGNYGLILD